MTPLITAFVSVLGSGLAAYFAFLGVQEKAKTKRELAYADHYGEILDKVAEYADVVAKQSELLDQYNAKVSYLTKINQQIMLDNQELKFEYQETQ